VYARQMRWLAWGAAGVLACTLTAGCSHSNPAAAPPAGGQTSAPAQASDSGSPAPSASSSGSVKNLIVTASVRRELRVAYLSYMHFPSSDIAGTAHNSVYYAYETATGTYWAMATFVASSTVSQSTSVSMQDGGSRAFFTKTADGAWQVQRGSQGSGEVCAEIKFFPAAVLTAWVISTTPPAGTSC
jgi:hypothetical protein